MSNTATGSGGSSGTGTKNPTVGPGGTESAPTYSDFFQAVLNGLGIKPTQGDLAALTDVVQTEGRNTYYNPFNIEWHPGQSAAWEGVGNWNSVGVQEYGSFDQGVKATEAFLSGNSHWGGVVAALQGGNQAQVENALQGAYTWAPLQRAGGNADSILLSVLGTSTPATVTPGAGGVITDNSIGTQAKNALDAITSPFQLAKKIYDDMTTTDWWIRVGMIILGFVLVIIAVDHMSNGGIVGAFGNGSDVGDMGQAAAQGASEASRSVAQAPQRAVETTERTARGVTTHTTKTSRPGPSGTVSETRTRTFKGGKQTGSTHKVRRAAGAAVKDTPK